MGGVLDSLTSDLEVLGLSKAGLSFEAVDTANGEEEIAGAFLCTTHRKGEENAIYSEVFRLAPMDDKFRRINDLTDFAKELLAPGIGPRFNTVTEYLEGVMLSVKESYSGQGIAKRLIKAVEDDARAKSIRLMYVGCSSEFTAKAMLRMGYEQVVTIPYDEYRKEGKPLFEIKPPHTAYKGFIKFLSE